MQAKHLHIISFDIPFPANYGGVIDVYYKLVWLHQLGIKIHLHCFEYGRKHAKELNAICESVTYYKRETGLSSHLSLLPYTVKSRVSKDLKKNLLKDSYPILCEVLHTCWIMNEPEFKTRFKIYRHSNIEHEYYEGLAKAEKSTLKKLFLLTEARKLKRFEKTIAKANLILAVNEHDTAYFKTNYQSVRTEYLPSFHSNVAITCKEGVGNYILFHGNLSVAENKEAAEWLVHNVFSKIQQQFIIAGLNPDERLNNLVEKFEHIDLITNPTEAKMAELVLNAHQHVLYTKQATGLKLKLLNVLFQGRHVICNSHMIKGSGVLVNESISVCDTASEMIAMINEKATVSFDNALLKKRLSICQPFNNQVNAEKLRSFL